MSQMQEQSTPSAMARPAPTSSSSSNTKHLNMRFEKRVFSDSGLFSPSGAMRYSSDSVFQSTPIRLFCHRNMRLPCPAYAAASMSRRTFSVRRRARDSRDDREHELVQRHRDPQALAVEAERDELRGAGEREGDPGDDARPGGGLGAGTETRAQQHVGVHRKEAAAQLEDDEVDHGPAGVLAHRRAQRRLDRFPLLADEALVQEAVAHEADRGDDQRAQHEASPIHVAHLLPPCEWREQSSRRKIYLPGRSAASSPRLRVGRGRRLVPDLDLVAVWVREENIGEPGRKLTLAQN